MSEVYVATIGQPSPETPDPPQVVLKIARILDKHGQFFHEALDNEVERLRRLKHPGIVRIYPIRRDGLSNFPYFARSGAGSKNDPPFSVLEYLTGGSLTDLLTQQKRLEPGLALEIARGLAATLDYVHNRNQVHLDIKPENILFRESPTSGRVEPVLIDFGIARDIGQQGLKAGTLYYSSPERLQATHRMQPPETAALPHPAMDIYSLGLVLYQMLTGHLPFQGRDRKSITSAILEGNPTLPSDYQSTLSAELDELVLLTINKDPAKRPTAEQLTIALERITIKLGHVPGGIRILPPTSNPTEYPDALSARSSRGNRPLIMGLTGLVITMLLFILNFTDWSKVNAYVGIQPTPVSATPEVVVAPDPTETPSAPPVSPTTVAASATPQPTFTPTVGASIEQPEQPEQPTQPAPPLPLSTLAPTRTPTTSPNRPAGVTQIQLQAPQDGFSSDRLVQFQWRPTGRLLSNQRYELILWRAGQQQRAFSVNEPVRDTTLSKDISDLARSGLIADLKLNETYFWGVRVVRCNSSGQSCTPTGVQSSGRRFTPR